MKFIHIADVHLGAAPDSGYPWSEDRRKEIWESFRRIVKRAGQDKTDLLLIAGDLFHRQPLLRELKEVNYLFSAIPETRVVFILGNHDFMKQDSFYRGFVWNENVICLEDEQCQRIHFPDLNTTVYGLSYHQREITQGLYDELIPEEAGVCTILLAHGGDENHIPINKKQLGDSGFDYIALGHIHKPQILIKNKMAYAGALEPLDRNELGPHGYIQGEFKNNRLTAEFVPCALREYVNLTIQSNEQQTNYSIGETIQFLIKERGREHIYKIKLKGLRDPDIRYDWKEIQKLGNIVEIEDTTQPAYDFDKLEQKYKDNVIGRYIRKLRSKSSDSVQNKALYYGVRALLDTMR